MQIHLILSAFEQGMRSEVGWVAQRARSRLKCIESSRQLQASLHLGSGATAHPGDLPQAPHVIHPVSNSYIYVVQVWWRTWWCLRAYASAGTNGPSCSGSCGHDRSPASAGPATPLQRTKQFYLHQWVLKIFIPALIYVAMRSKHYSVQTTDGECERQCQP